MFDAALRRLPATALLDFARALLVAAELPPDRAQDVAEVLLEGDLLGHSTHGLALLPRYLQEIRAGHMTISGDPLVVADYGSTLTWDGGYLPGAWLVRRAIDEARGRLAEHPMAAIVMRRCHRIACLQAYLKPAADEGLLGVLLEAITSALAGHGRHVQEARWGCSVFLMLIDPANFGGRAAFARETSYLAGASRAAAVPSGEPAVRMPGEHALLRRAEQLTHGVALHSDTLPALLTCAADLSVDIPSVLKG